jgi:hypothetical protein
VRAAVFCPEITIEENVVVADFKETHQLITAAQAPLCMYKKAAALPLYSSLINSV